MSFATSVADRELIVTRLVNLPRAAVYQTWVDLRLALRWWGSDDYPATHAQLDLRPGGVWSGRFRMRETGHELRGMGVINEVVPPSRLIYTFAWEENGVRGPETLVTVKFEEKEADLTLITLHQRPFRSREERDDYATSWLSSLDRFEACARTV